MNKFVTKQEIDCERIRAENKELLIEFTAWLEAQGLSRKTITPHVSYSDLYINHYLLYESTIEAKNGSAHIFMFFRYWFKRKVYPSIGVFKNTITSIKRFYTFMYEKGFISEEEFTRLKETIKKERKGWVLDFS